MKKKLNKKTIIIIVAVVAVALIALFIAAQGDDNKGGVEDMHINPFMNYTLTEAPMMNGFGDEQIGTYAYIYVAPGDMEKATPEDYLEFANANVKGKDYSYVTIACSDKTGARWSASMLDYVYFGEIDSNRQLTSTTAVWQLDNGKYVDITEQYLAEQAELEE